LFVKRNIGRYLLLIMLKIFGVRGLIWDVPLIPQKHCYPDEEVYPSARSDLPDHNPDYQSARHGPGGTRVRSE